MPRTVIADTSCLIIFQKIGKLDLLQKVYGSVSITPEVAKEFSSETPDWVIIESPIDKKYQNFLETQIDPGEQVLLHWPKKKESYLLVLDDLKARKLSLKLNLKFTGVTHKAKQIGILKKIKPIIERLQASGFRISENIIFNLLRINNEIED